MSRRRLSAISLALLLPACADDPATDLSGRPQPVPAEEIDAGPSPSVDADMGPVGPITVVELVDLPEWLPAQVVTRVRAQAPAGVVRVELYLDGARVGEALFAPFDISWNTAPFGEGAHELRALAHLATGETAEVRKNVSFDHTAPLVDAPGEAGYPALFQVAASDAPSGLARVVLVGPGEGERTIVDPPYDFEWLAGCGSSQVRVIAIDHAGNQSEVTRAFVATDTRDVDCDAYFSIVTGGGDCDDGDPTIHPDTVDTGELAVDRNCDGVAGVDADGDGVPSYPTGGTDCDEADPAVHGAWLRWISRLVDLQPFHAVSLVRSQDEVVEAGIRNHEGSPATVDVVRHDLTGAGEPVHEQVAELSGNSGFDVAAIETDNGPAVFYADLDSVWVATRGPAGWQNQLVDQVAGAQIYNLDLARDLVGNLHAVFSTYAFVDGLQVYGARHVYQQAGGWVVEILPDGQVQPQPAPQIVVTADDLVHVVYATTSGLRHAVGVGEARTFFSVQTPLGPLTRLGARRHAAQPTEIEIVGLSTNWWNDYYFVAGRGAGEIIADQYMPHPPGSISRLHVGEQDLVVQTYASQLDRTYVLRTQPGGFVWQALPGLYLRTASQTGETAMLLESSAWPSMQLVVPTDALPSVGCGF